MRGEFGQFEGSNDNARLKRARADRIDGAGQCGEKFFFDMNHVLILRASFTIKGHGLSC